jgi:mRNA-degrading endonuclease toxin of MazEF toxin-antitoxin module
MQAVVKPHKTTYCRGDIFWAHLGNTVGHEIRGDRPVVIIQGDAWNRASTVIVAPMTASENAYRRQHPLDLQIDSQKYGLNYDHQTILLNQIRTLDKIRLGNKVASLDDTDLKRLEKIISLTLGIKKVEVKEMNELIVIEHKGQRVLTTQQLAEKYETEPQVITNNFNRNKERYQIGIHYFILEGQDLKGFRATNQFDFSLNLNKLYLWTEKGCLFHAKSLGTDKAWEVYEMLIDTYFRIKELAQPQTIEDLIILQAQSVKELKIQVQTQAKQIETIKKTVVSRKDDWRQWVNEQMNLVAKERGNLYFETKSESYRILRERAGCDLDTRLKNLKERLRTEGQTKTAIKNANKLDVIEADPKLKEIYAGIIKEMAIKYVV